jgi:hypothetical protein
MKTNQTDNSLASIPNGGEGGGEEALTIKAIHNYWLRIAFFLAGVLALAGLLAAIPDRARAQVAGSPTATASSTAVSATLVAFKGYCTAYNLAAYSTNTTATVYLLVFDTNAVPANGTAPTLPPIKMVGNQTASITVDGGIRFTNGIVVGLSTTDTTFTSTNCGWFNAVYLAQ